MYIFQEGRGHFSHFYWLKGQTDPSCMGKGLLLVFYSKHRPINTPFCPKDMGRTDGQTETDGQIIALFNAPYTFCAEGHNKSYCTHI